MIKNISLPLAAFLFGIFGHSFFTDIFSVPIFSLFVLFFVGWFFVYFKKKIWIISLIFLLIGINYPNLFQKKIFPETFLQTEVLYEGVVTSFPEEKNNFKQVYFSTTKPVVAKFLLKTSKDFLLFYGQELAFTGRAYLPPKFGNFDYQKYLARHNVSAIVSIKSDIKILDTNQANPVIFRAQKTRQKIQESLEKIFPSDQATISTGMLLGVKKNLSETVDENFRQAGLTHLLVVSGANVSLIIILVSLFLRPFGRPIIFVGSMTTILFFIGMTGFDPPIIRASIMGGLIALAPLTGRIPDYKIILLLSAALIALINPKIIQQDIGFFLSFVATSGIILATPILLFYWQKIFKQRFLFIGKILSVTVAAQIFVLPVSAFFFESFPLGGFIANIIAEPLVPFITIGSIFVTFFSLLPLWIAKILSLPIYILIEILIGIGNIFSKLPALEISRSVALVLIIFEVIILLFLFFSKQIEEKFYLRENDVLDFGENLR